MFNSRDGVGSKIERLPEWPPRTKPVTIVSGEGQLTLNVPGAERYRYWVRVQHGVFSQRHALMIDIETWLEQQGIEFESNLDRYYFVNEYDVTMLLLRWA